METSIVKRYRGTNSVQEVLKRTRTNSGTVRNENLAIALARKLQGEGRMANLRLAVLPEACVKTGTNTITNLYSLDKTPNDLTTSAAPYLSGFIAPNEKYAILNPNGGSRFLSHPTISFAANEPWTVSIMLNWNGKTGTGDRLFGAILNNSAFFTHIGTNELFFKNESGSASYLGTNLFHGKNTFLQLIAPGNGKLKVGRNGSFIEYTIATNFVFELLLKAYTIYTSGKVYFYAIESTSLSEAQCLADYNFWRSYIPEIETVQIGTQQWATSNLDIVTTPMGTAIPEVTDNAAWAALTTPAWCHYNNDSANGAIYGKLYNWYAVKQIQDDITAYNAANPTKPWGYHIPTQSELTTLQTFLEGASVAGSKMKVTGTSYWASPNTGATNESGFTGLGGGRRRNDTGAFAANTTAGYFASITESSGNYYLLYISSADAVANIITGVKKLGTSIRLIKD